MHTTYTYVYKYVYIRETQGMPVSKKKTAPGFFRELFY